LAIVTSFSGYMAARLPGDAFWPCKNFEVLAAKDSCERDARLIGHFYRQGCRSGDRGDNGRAKPGRFLNEFDRDPARQKNSAIAWRGVRRGGRADDLVEGVMVANVFPYEKIVLPKP
jgi:hypothetical protein